MTRDCTNTESADSSDLENVRDDSEDWERNVQHYEGHNEKSIGDEDESEDEGGHDDDNEDDEGEEEEEEEEEDANYWSF
jgi:hypothetical protein